MEQQLQQSAADTVEIDEEFNEQCLESHNRYRELHGCPPLTLSHDLAASSQMWAQYLCSIGYLKHSPNSSGKFGENVAMKMVMGSQLYTGDQATAQWYSEIEFYDFDGPENQSRCGHFSQVVWKSTKEAGFGKAIAPDGKMFAVGQYTPPGNFMNKWMINIPRPISGQIQVPTQEDIMGVQQPQKTTKTVSKSSGKIKGGSSGGGAVNEELAKHLAASEGDRSDPKPHDASDRQVGKATKTKIVNGEKTVTVTITFMRPDGSKYQESKETVTQVAPAPASGVKVTQGIPSLGMEQVIQPMRQRRNFAAPPPADNGDVNGDSGEAEQFRSDMLELHNQLRQRHAAKQLQRSTSLDNLATTWARHLCELAELSHCRTAQLNGSALGQNIAVKPRDLPPPATGALQLSPAAQLAHQWLGERSAFQFGVKQPADIRGGHFTQMVWRNTEKLGVGYAKNARSGDIYAVCYYYPCGNVEYEFANNVRPEQ